MTATTVTVAIANPADVWAVSELERLARPKKVQWVLASAQEIRAAFQQAAPFPGPSRAPLPEPPPHGPA